MNLREFNKKVYDIENIISTTKIIVGDVIMGINLFYLKQYDKLIRYVGDLELKCKTTEEKKKYLEYWKIIFLSENKMYRRILKNIKDNSCDFIVLEYYENKDKSESVKEHIKTFWKKYDEEKTIQENLNDFIIAKIESKIWSINNELYELREHPSIFYNNEENYVGSNFRLKYDNDIIKYKDVDIRSGRLHSYVLFSNDNSKEINKRTLLNILAFFDCEPYYYMTDNAIYNKKLEILYEQFDILDLVKLRKKKFLETNLDEPIHLEKPILKSNANLVCFKDLQHEEILDLYHSSLKQAEPLPRCVFLYRVFEYGAAQHYKKIFKPQEYKPEEALDYYISEIIKYNFNPIYYIDYGRYISDDRMDILEKRKPQLRNFITVIKNESKQILKEWEVHPYLKNKNSPGDIIYNTGRNLVAHGGNGSRNMKYDYDRNYKHINDINIILELIARYLVENLNPYLKNCVERRKEYYIKDKYKSLFGQGEK